MRASGRERETEDREALQGRLELRGGSLVSVGREYAACGELRASAYAAVSGDSRKLDEPITCLRCGASVLAGELHVDEQLQQRRAGGIG